VNTYWRRRLSVTNYSSENNLLTFRLNAPVTIRVNVKEVRNNITNVSGYTLLSLTNKPAIIRQLLRHGATPDYQLCSTLLPSKCPKCPAPQVVKTFVVGDPGTGKSTLTKSLQTESNMLSYLANRMSKVSGVDQKTMGIVPRTWHWE